MYTDDVCIITLHYHFQIIEGRLRRAKVGLKNIFPPIEKLIHNLKITEPKDINNCCHMFTYISL
jgi:hypothetical protein